MRIVYEFDLAIDDKQDVEIFQRSDKMYLALTEIYNLVRNELKHGEHELHKDTVLLLEEIKRLAYFDVDE